MFHPARWTAISCVTLVVMAAFVFTWREGAVFAEADRDNIPPTPRERYLAADTERELEAARREYVRDLRKRYGDPGTREEHVGLDHGANFAQRSRRLFREWNPVFFKADDVRELLGPPWAEDEASLLYSFRLDFAMMLHWRIRVFGDIVIAIEHVPDA